MGMITRGTLLVLVERFNTARARRIVPFISSLDRVYLLNKLNVNKLNVSNVLRTCDLLGFGEFHRSTDIGAKELAEK